MYDEFVFFFFFNLQNVAYFKRDRSHPITQSNWTYVLRRAITRKYIFNVSHIDIAITV